MRFPWFVRWVLLGLVCLGFERGATADEAEAAPVRVPSRLDLSPDQVDAHSFGNPHQVRVRHVALDLSVDFEREQLQGHADLYLERIPGAPEGAWLWLDTDALDIEQVQAAQGGEDWEAVPYEEGPVTIPEDERSLFPSGERSDGTPIHGTPLRIALPDDADSVRITYRTDPGAKALQWLEPEQTEDGSKPFLFSQSQAIHARSWIPLQDSPGVRVTYVATIRVPEGVKALMSADGNFQEDDDAEVFHFEMPQPIPPYLLALAVGDLEFRSMGPTSGVYAEPSVVEIAAREFDDTEAMIEATEARFGPYRWGRYDILVLPPSFPFGGMENPRLTFATPTVLVGDKSLVSLVAHELAHSWSGNLVSNATWSDFWLNEGFTTYIEGRIIEDVYGPERAAMESVLGLQRLKEELERLKPDDQVLYLDLRGRDPDEGVTAVPYEKGRFFLYVLEQTFGRERFDEFLRDYFNHFAFQSITTEQFRRALVANLFPTNPQAAETIDLDAWLNRPGLPDFEAPTSGRFATVEAQADAWLDETLDVADLETDGWSTQEWLHFLNGLPDDLDADRLAELDAVAELTETPNAEIAAVWLQKAIRAGYDAADERLESFLTSVGRRKFLMPLYNELARTPDGLSRAREIYAKARPSYHPIAVESVDQLLEPPPSELE